MLLRAAIRAARRRLQGRLSGPLAKLSDIGAQVLVRDHVGRVLASSIGVLLRLPKVVRGERHGARDDHAHVSPAQRLRSDPKEQ